MGDLNGRLLLLVVAVTVFAGLLIGWIGGIAGTGLAGVTGTVGFVVGVVLLLALLVVTWFVLEERRTTG